MVWTFPKGHPEKGESDEDAALREVREETGWECRVVKPLIDVDYFYTHGKVKTHKTVRWFLMEPLKQIGGFDPVEIVECAWMNPQEARQNVTYDSDKKLLDAIGF